MKESLIKFYYYIERGLDILNTFRNLFLAIFAGYFALQLNNYWLMALAFAVSIPILAGIGWYNVHFISKVRDRLNIGFGTHYGIKQFDYTKRMAELLEIIAKQNETRN